MDYSKLTIDEIISILEQKDRKIQHLEYELEQIKRVVFGSKTERFVPQVPPEQLKIFEQKEAQLVQREENEKQEQVDKKKGKEKKKKKKPVRQPLPGHLKREVQIIEPKVDVSSMRYIGEHVIEKLEMTPVQFYVRKIILPKYVDQSGKIHIGSSPVQAFPKCIAGASVAAHVSVSKYVDHSPLYRQSQIYSRQQVELPRSTLVGIIQKGSDLVGPIYQKLIEKAMNADYLQVDESSLRVLTRNHPDGKIKGCMLVKVAPLEKIAVMEYTRTKEKSVLNQSLQGFQGYVQVDGNVSYESLADKQGVELMHCMVHSRRYFEKALDYHREKASYALGVFQQLYSIERKAREENLDTDAILALRQKESVPILENLRKWLEQNAHLDEPTDPINRAVRYMLKRWDGLIKYTSNGKLLADNNLIENQIRPLALGRKNYLFAASHRGAEYAATFYSLFATCRLNGLDPLRWLTDVYQRIQGHPINRIEELLPLDGYQFRER